MKAYILVFFPSYTFNTLKKITFLITFISSHFITSYSQNVGIGITNPQAKMEIKQSNNLQPTLMLSDSTGVSAGKLRFRSLLPQYSNRSWYINYKVGTFSKDNEMFLYNDSTNVMNIYGTGNITIGDAVTPNARLSILSENPSSDILNIMGNSYQPAFKILGNKNVGIGLTNPVEKFDVNGNSRFSGYIRAQAIALHNTTTYLPSNNALLDMVSNNKGILIPRMAQGERDAITFPDLGLMIFQTNNNPGFYYNKGNGVADWIKVGAENNDKEFLGYENAGTFTYTVPQGISSMEFEAISSGGGGGGGQIYNANYCGVGGGGGGGGYFQGLLKVKPGDVLTINIGAPGIGGVINTTPIHGTDGTDAGNTSILVNGNLALEISGGKGGKGGYSDGTYNTGLGITGGVGGAYLVSSFLYFIFYNASYLSNSGEGASTLIIEAFKWGGAGYTLAYPQYAIIDAAHRPINGRGGYGGNYNDPGGNGVVGYVKFKY